MQIITIHTFWMIHCNLERWKTEKQLQSFSMHLCIRSMMTTNQDTFWFHRWHNIFRNTSFSKLDLILSYDKHWRWYWNSTIDHHEKVVGCIMRSFKPPNMSLPIWTLSPLEDHNNELYQKTVVGITYNTIKGLKMKQDMRHMGYYETESKYCTIQERVQW